MTKIVADSGTGRPIVFVLEESVSSVGDLDHKDFAQEILTSSFLREQSQKSRVVVYATPTVTNENWKERFQDFVSDLETLKIRNASFVGIGATCVLTQELALHNPKMVRWLMLIDATCRPHPTKKMLFMDSLERKIPLGLPFRMSSGGFDSKPFLHRIRCPVLVATSPDSSPYERREAAVLAAGLPTGWRHELPKISVEEIELAILSFQNVQAKCPQKGRGKN